MCKRPSAAAEQRGCDVQNFPGFIRGLMAFLGLSIPAAIVNSGLRCVPLSNCPCHFDCDRHLLCSKSPPESSSCQGCEGERVVIRCVLCRFFQKQIQLAFMMRLTRHLHRLYCSNRSYYAASVLGGSS